MNIIKFLGGPGYSCIISYDKCMNYKIKAK